MSMPMIIFIVCIIVSAIGTMLKAPGIMMLGFAGALIDAILIGLGSTGVLSNLKF